jgi:hypothetical protein
MKSTHSGFMHGNGSKCSGRSTTQASAKARPGMTLAGHAKGRATNPTPNTLSRRMR